MGGWVGEMIEEEETVLFAMGFGWVGGWLTYLDGFVRWKRVGGWVGGLTHLMAMGRYMKRRRRVIFQGCFSIERKRALALLPASGPSPCVLV